MYYIMVHYSMLYMGVLHPGGQDPHRREDAEALQGPLLGGGAA